MLSGNTFDGIYLEGSAAANNLLVGNLVGTNAAGTAALANKNDGVLIESSGNTVGAAVQGDGNVISGNSGYGLVFSVAGAAGNLVLGNRIGTNAAGTAAGSQPMAEGIVVTAAGNTIGGSVAGAGNVISGNAGDGVESNGSTATGNVVAGQPDRHRRDGENAVGQHRDGI